MLLTCGCVTDGNNTVLTQCALHGFTPPKAPCPDCGGRGYIVREKANPNTVGFAMANMQPCIRCRLRRGEP